EAGMPDVMQVGTGPRRQRDVAAVRVFDDAFDVAVHEDHARVRQLNFRDPGVVVHDPTELLEAEEAGADLRLDHPLCRRTARTGELADGGRLEPDPVPALGLQPADAVTPH